MIQTLCKCAENGPEVVGDVELSSASLDNHIKQSRTNLRVQNITHNELHMSPLPPLSWFTVILEGFRGEL